MGIYLLGTSVIVDALNQKRDRWRFLASWARPATEIYAGIRPHESLGTGTFLDGLEHYSVDSELARYAGRDLMMFPLP